MDNTICHVEFTTKDMEKTSEFFQNVFGWKVTPMGDAYALWQAGEEGLGGGFSTQSAEVQGPGTLAYIAVADIEATLASINEKGGQTAVPKTKISDEHGFFAVFTDPGGTSVALWSKS